MKHIVRFIVLAVALVMGLSTVSAQNVHVDVIQKVPTLPATATNYVEDPFRYFDIVVYAFGVSGEGLEVYFDIDFSVNDGSFYIRTKPDIPPRQSIILHEGSNVIKRDVMLSQFRGGRQDNNIDLSKPLNAQLLPEGTYSLCLDVYHWSDRLNPARVPISDDNCPSYDICYSGSAPELVAPTTGAEIAMNGAMVVAPERKINFFWTPVISNCAGNKSRFKYKLKVVKVVKGQNYQDAIKYNPTVFSAEVRNGNYAVFDTLRDVKVHMEKGALYVAQVEAEKIKSGRDMDAFIIANDGKSQPVPFYWEYAGDDLIGGFIREYDAEVDIDDAEEGDEGEDLEGLTQWQGGVEEVSGLDAIIEEMQEPYVVPNPKRHFVESDGYYTIPMTDDIEIGYKPAWHEALKSSTHVIKLYEDVDQDVDSITAREPLFTEQLGELPQEFGSRTLAGWGANLKQGELYYLEMTSTGSVSYWNYSVADTNFYVNDMLAENIHDTISREFIEKDDLVRSQGVFFQWGDDPNAPSFTTPQWNAPVDRTRADIYDPASYMVPASVTEVKKAKTFPVSWTPVKNVAEGDEVEYEVNVYELKPGQTVEEAVSENKLLATRTVTDANEISSEDTKFFKVFSSSKTYVMTLSTTVSGEGSYHFENGNEAIPIVFKVVK